MQRRLWYLLVHCLHDVLLVTGYQTCVNHKSCLVFVCYSFVTDFRSSEMCCCVVRKVSEDEGTVLL